MAIKAKNNITKTKMSEDFKLDFDAFVRSFAQINSQGCSFLLGAGCSIGSGVPSASKCIWDWKQMLYQSKNPYLDFVSVDSDNNKREIQRWCELQPDFPPLNSIEEYSFYVEKVYPIELDRISYFENLFTGKKPSIGYKFLVGMSLQGVLQSVWTTNFDNLTLKAAEGLEITTYSIAIENQQAIYDSLMRNGLKYVALHGDYKFSKLKNTEAELYSQESHFVGAMTSHFAEKHLIVIGYSGRDKSLMTALHQVFSQAGGGRLYWLGMDNEPSEDIHSLIVQAKKSGRFAAYVQAPGFDESLYHMYRQSFGETDFFRKVLEANDNQKATPNVSPFNFHMNGKIIQLGTTNLLPVTVPQNCYAFGLRNSEQKSMWDTLKSKIDSKFIAATIYEGKVYAFGSIKEIYATFGSDIIDQPTLLNIPYDSYAKLPILKKLALKAILLGIARKTNLNLNFNGLLWEKNSSYDNHSGIQEAIRVSLRSVPDKNFMFMSFSPTLHFDEISNVNKPLKQKLCREYIDKLRNRDHYQVLSKWIYRIFKESSRLYVKYPENGNEFTFSISCNTACCKIYGDGTPILPTTGFKAERILYSGMKVPEPKLLFGSSDNNDNKYKSDINPMRGLRDNVPFDLPSFALSPPNLSIGIICPISKCEALYNFLIKLNSGNIMPRYPDYVQKYPGFASAYKISLDIPYYEKSDMWVKCKDNQPDGFKLAQNICSHIDKMANVNPQVVIVIFIPNQWSNVRTISTQGIEIDFHDYIKSHCAQKGITTQFIEEKTLNNRYMECEVLWWLSLAIFVKSGRTPWTLGSLNQDSAYAGIGYSLSKTKEKKSIVIGCSHLYNAHGQGLKFRLRKIDNPFLDRKKNPFLSKDEAYKLGLNIVELFRDSMYKVPNRVVIHKRTIFRQEEIEGLSKALLPHVQDLELITIESESDFKLLPAFLGKSITAEGYPVKRGTCIPIDTNQAFLWTHGTIESINSGKMYYQGGKGIPRPLKLTRCFGTSSLEEIASEILSFTKINWNSFNFYSQMPATIETSNIVANIGRLLQHYNGNTFDYKYFI